MSIGRLKKHLDLEVIARMERRKRGVEGKPTFKRVKPPRAASTYRGERRNRVLRELKTTWGPQHYYR